MRAQERSCSPSVSASFDFSCTRSIGQILGRSADPVGLEYFVRALKSGKSPFRLAEEIKNSPEAAERRRRDGFSGGASAPDGSSRNRSSSGRAVVRRRGAIENDAESNPDNESPHTPICSTSETRPVGTERLPGLSDHGNRSPPDRRGMARKSVGVASRTHDATADDGVGGVPSALRAFGAIRRLRLSRASTKEVGSSNGSSTISSIRRYSIAAS